MLDVRLQRGRNSPESVTRKLTDQLG
jgi:hypothetical protein